MIKRAVLELKGNLAEQGFYITLNLFSLVLDSKGRQVNAAIPAAIIQGYLPPSLPLKKQLNQWQQDYRRLSLPTRAITPYKLKYDGSILPVDACVESARQLTTQFQQWLRSESFREIDLFLRQALIVTDTVDVLIQTIDPDLQALPWHLWDFFEQYPKAEVSISSAIAYQTHAQSSDVKTLSQINVLAVFGDRARGNTQNSARGDTQNSDRLQRRTQDNAQSDPRINTESDRHSLSRLPGAYVEYLDEPSHHDFNDKLYERPWHILCFAGHSETQTTGQGVLRLNDSTNLTMEEIRYALRKAISNGLQLAIFNSCNGLGLAHALAELQLPQMIVMREAIPDPVAQRFLQYLLQSLAKGMSLNLAEREARERLQGMETIYPCASWLPMLYQHPTAPALQWHPQPRYPPIKRPLVSGLLASSLVIGGQAFGLLQLWELRFFDYGLRHRPGQNIPDSRILIIAVEDEDIQYQRSQGMEITGSLSDEALLALLQKISSHQPSVIGLDMIHDYPWSSDLTTYWRNISRNISQPDLVAICSARNHGSDISGIAPPSALSASQNSPPMRVKVGFNNVPRDGDGVIRRQFLGMPPGPICPVSKSLSLQIAQSYLLKSHGIELKWIADSTDRQQIQLGNQQFIPLTRQAGGYHLTAADAGGYQILVNYRATPPEQVSLREILSGSLDPQLPGLIRDRILIVGLVNPTVDRHRTPYQQGQQSQTIPGVMVQAHMISQIISAALEERPLLSWWPPWAESLWVIGWGSVGAIVMTGVRSPQMRGIVITISLIMVLIMGWLLLTWGWWVPSVAGAIALGLAAWIYWIWSQSPC